ncbi:MULTISPECIES: hypothetical protein [Pseudomonas]|nr:MULTISPECIES: hypothetical protein [Pseudomonas]
MKNPKINWVPANRFGVKVVVSLSRKRRSRKPRKVVTQAAGRV